jgi:hypothetical protein
MTRAGRGFMEKEYVLGGDFREADSSRRRSFRAGRREIDVLSHERTR